MGEPNEENCYVIWPHTPISLIETDKGSSGVSEIYLEVYLDGIIRDTIWYEIAVVNFTLSEFCIYGGLMEHRWYAVDNAENVEEMHYQEHPVMEG